MGAATILAPLLEALEADDYHSTVIEADGLVHVDVQAGPNACDECLVPKDLMESMLTSTLQQAGVNAQVQVTYPAAHHDSHA